MRIEFEIFKQTMKFMLNGMEIPGDKRYLYILQQLGRKGMEQWNASIKDTVHTDNPDQIFKAFKKGFEIAETYWTYRNLYLSSAKQSPSESVAALAIRFKDLVAQCEWLKRERERERRHICNDKSLHVRGSVRFLIKRYQMKHT